MRRPYIPTEPLGQPRGSIRAVMAIMVVSGIVFGFFADKITGDQFVAIAIIVIGWYFKDRPSTPQPNPAPLQVTLGSQKESQP